VNFALGKNDMGQSNVGLGCCCVLLIRLSRYFGLSERIWRNLQSRYDLETEKDRLKGHIEEEVKVLERKTT
jgi:plasmid maintenance system antidote protein VapI